MQLDLRSQQPSTTNSHSEFDSLLREIEASPEGAANLAEGRRWVAETFYPDRPTLAQLRLKAGLSQQLLGDKCGIAQSHVSRYESGKHEPTLSTARCLAAALGVTLQEFDEAWISTRAAADATGGK